MFYLPARIVAPIGEFSRRRCRVNAPKKLPPVVRLELPAAIDLQKLLVRFVEVLDPQLTDDQQRALEKFDQRIREAESRS